MFKNKDFILLLIGRFITNFGDSIYTIATMSLVYSMTGSSYYTGLALFLTSSTAIVQVILSPVLDKINMKKFLVITQTIQGFLLLIITYLLKNDMLNVYYLLGIMTVVSLINQLVYPGQLSILPKIVKQENLVKANSLFSIAYQGSDAIFNALSGFVISFFGFMTTYYIDSATFFINTILFVFLSKTLGAINEQSKFTLKSHFRELKAGLKIWENQHLKAILVGIILINFAGTAIFATLPEFTLDESFYGILLSASGIGVMIGSILANQDFIKKISLGKMYIIFILTTGLLWMLMPMFDLSTLNGKTMAFLTFLGGWSLIGILNIYSQTMVQMIVPKNELGVALSSMIGVSVALAPLGALSSGLLSRYYNVQTIIILSAGLIILVGLYWLCNKNIRNLGLLNDINFEVSIKC